MGSKRFLFTFGLGGGFAAGLAIALGLYVATGQPQTGGTWAFVVLTCIATYTLFGYLTWFIWAGRRNRARGELIARLAAGDLRADPPMTGLAAERDVYRLIVSLRRALFQVQRVTANVHRTGREVGDQARLLLEAARRQGSAVDRSLTAVHGMGDSLSAAGERVTQLARFADETAASLSEMTDRISQVGSVLATLDESAHRMSEAVESMSERLASVAASGDVLARFAKEAEAFVVTVEGGIDAVRRRSHETGDLAREVSATAERGQALVQDSVQGMYRVEETVRRAETIVDALGARSIEIGRIVDVIQEVADQTNLLALNAAIIAAQAGEHGRPFGVVADAIRGLSERVTRSTREIGAMVSGVRTELETAVTLVKEGRESATQGVALADRASGALKEIRSIIRRTGSAVEATIAETGKLETQGRSVVEASQRLALRVEGIKRAAVVQAGAGRELVQRTQEMARLAKGASEQAAGQVQTGRALNVNVERLTQAIDDIRSAHRVLTQGDTAISEEVSQVREDARSVLRIGDGLSRSVEQLEHEADGLEEQVFRFQLPEPRRGGSLVVGIHQGPMVSGSRGLDPLFTLDNQLVEITANLYRGLLKSSDGVVVPDLAEHLETSASARRYRFKLRARASFHDGSVLGMADVKRHFERLLDPRVNSPDAWIFKDVSGARDFIEGRAPSVRGFEVLDEQMLEIRLEEPKAFFLHLLTLPATLVAKPDANGKLMGTGPFRVVESTDARVVLERNPTYVNPELPRVDRLEFRLCEDRAQALTRLRAGELDVVSGLYAEHLAPGGGLEDLQVSAGSTPSTWFLGFNLLTAPFDDLRVRQALRVGLDVQGVVERFHPGARAAASLTPPELLARETFPAPRPDLARARTLLREAGQGRLRVTLCFPPGRNTEVEDRVLFAPLLEAGLIELVHQEVPAADFWQRCRDGTLGVFRAVWIADYPDPDNFLHFLLNSQGQTVYNFGYASPELDALTHEARQSIDPERRQQLYRRAEKRVHEDVPVVPLYHEQIYAAASHRVQGLRMHQTPPQLRFEELWVSAG